nr:ubiquitin carboxyl-terminal hydrolase 13-like [Quercus suber]
MLVHYDQTSDILYYEVLDIPLPELQGLKTLKVAVHQATKPFDPAITYMQIFPLGEKIENIIDHYWTIRAEEIPEEEKNLGPNDRLIHVYHFIKDRAQNPMKIENFGEPFFMVMHEGETLAEIKVRIQKKLQVPDEEFAKFAFLSQGRPEYLQDSDIVSSHFQSILDWSTLTMLINRAYTANQGLLFC